MADSAWWRQVFDAGERAVATRLEAAVHTDEFANLLVLLVKSRREVNRALDDVRTAVLHMGGIVTVTDIRRIASTLRRIEAEVRELTALVEGQRDGADPADGDATASGSRRGSD